MQITLTDPLRSDRRMNAEVTDRADENENWVTASIECAWSYLRYTGSETITVSSKDQPASEDGRDVRIATLSLTLHDE